MLKRSFFLLAALSLIAGFTVPANANLVENPSFENGASGLIFSDGNPDTGGNGRDVGTCPSPCTIPHTGSWAGFKNLYDGGSGTISQQIQTIIGHTYLIEAWLADNTFEQGTVTVSFGSTVGVVVTGLDTSPSYRQYIFEHVATSESTTLAFGGNVSSGTFFVDDFSVTDITECGNGVIEAGEECDDGNVEDGDRCSSECMCATPPLEQHENLTEWEPRFPRGNWSDGQVLGSLSSLLGEELRIVWRGSAASGYFETRFIDSNGGVNLLGRCNFIHGWNTWYYSGPLVGKGRNHQVEYFSRVRLVNIDGGYDDAQDIDGDGQPEGKGKLNEIDIYEYVHDACRTKTITRIALSPYNEGCEVDGIPAISDWNKDWRKPLPKCRFQATPQGTVEGSICLVP
jgi:cysteine-rich repeat protein